jgi:lysophospholipase L1-like esterase
MIRLSLALACFAILVASSARAADGAGVTLKKGDRIVFLGDSITQQGGDKTGYVTLIKNAMAEKHKDLDIEVFNAGISGNKVPDLQRRLEKDVISKKPTIVYIYIGINDVWHGASNPANGTSKEKFEEGLNDVIDRLTKSGAKVILCTPTVIGEKKAGANKLDAKLDEYSDISRKIAKEKKLPLCDLRKAFVDYLKEKNSDDKERGILTGDTVHLNDAGNKLVAETMLKMVESK